MAPLPSQSIPQEISLILSSILISLLILTVILIKCLRHRANQPVSLINSSNTTVNKFDFERSKTEIPNSGNTQTAIFMDESTRNELEAPICPIDSRNPSLMNLLLSHTPQSSFHHEGPQHSVSHENILIPPLPKSHSPSPLATTPRNRSEKSLDSVTVLENLNSACELRETGRKKCGSVSRDSSPVPDYDEVVTIISPINSESTSQTSKESPSKTLLKTSFSAEPRRSEAIQQLDPPELPARNVRLSSLPTSKRPTINKPPIAGDTEEVYESIQDEFVPKQPDKHSSQSKTDDENGEDAYACVDSDRMKPFTDPPSLPAPRLPEPIKPSKEAAKPLSPQEKKIRKKNRNSLHEKTDNLIPEPVEGNEPQRKKTKSFTPFNYIRPKKAASEQFILPTSPGPTLEASGEHSGKFARGALPPLPSTHHSDESDSDKGYSCITATSPPVLSKSSASSTEDPYSELTFDPKKKKIYKPAMELPTNDVVAIDYTQTDDGNHSPMEIDEAYSCIDDVKSKTKPLNLNTTNEEVSCTNPLSDTDLSPRALPSLPVEPKVKIAHQYVKAEVIKKRKAEQRSRKEEEKRLSGLNTSTEENISPLPEIELVEQILPTSQFPSLKSIFSDFRKDGEDIVTQNMALVLGLPPPEPPNDSDDETQSYASAAEVRGRKAKKPPVNKPDVVATVDMNRILEYEPSSMEVNAASFMEDIGDHTYSSVTDLLTEASPYEEPKLVIDPFTPTYEDPDDLSDNFQKNFDYEPKSKIDDSVEYETLKNEDSEISPKVSQDLSKLREQKGYVKVSHQKENIPEYASIDDVKKEKITAENDVENALHSTDDQPVTPTQELQDDTTDLAVEETLKDDL